MADKCNQVLMLIKDIENLDALKTIHTAAFNKRQRLRNIEANTLGWFVTQKVILKEEHQDRKPFDKIGTVLKVNPVKVRVNFGEYGIYNVPKTMLENHNE